MKVISDEIAQFIAENGGNYRDALNVALARLESATALLHQATEEQPVNEKLVDALRKILDIRFAEYPDGDESAPYKIIARMQRIAHNALMDCIEQSERHRSQEISWDELFASALFGFDSSKTLGSSF